MAPSKKLKAKALSKAAPVTVVNPAPVVKPVAAAPAPAPVPATPVAAKPIAPVAAAPAPVAAMRILSADQKQAIAQQVAKLRDPDAEVARDAATTLSQLPADTASVDALSQVVRNEDGYFHCVVRSAAAAALGQLGDRRAVEALIVATRDPMAEASAQAINALGQLRDARALPALEAVVRNADGYFLEHVRKTAEEALIRLRGKVQA